MSTLLDRVAFMVWKIVRIVSCHRGRIREEETSPAGRQACREGKRVGSQALESRGVLGGREVILISL